VLRAVAFLALGACSGASAGATHAPPCPVGALDLTARSEAIVARLSSVPEGAAVVEATRGRVGRICFAAEGPSVVDSERTILLDRALGDGEAAARVGHLLLHVRDGSPYPDGPTPGDADCDALVARALDAEAIAHAFELDLRRALHVEPEVLVYELEGAYWAAPEAERVALVRQFLVDHPRGGGGVDALAAGYRERCELGRRR
jgi:hypothetical protein